MVKKSIEKGTWDGFHRKKPHFLKVDKYMPEIVKLFQKYDVKKVLDLASGTGVHSVFLAERDFEVYGFDFSNEAIKLARKSLTNKNLKAELTVHSIFDKFPFNSNFFDAVICTKALHHSKIENIRRAIKEIERVLRPYGLVYITTRGKISKKKRVPSKKIAYRTFIPLEGDEKSVIHYLFNKRLMKREFRDFEILRLNVKKGLETWGKYNYLLAQKSIKRSIIDILISIGKALEGKRLKWCIVGTTSLLLQGVDIRPGDIDILTDKEGAYRFNELFNEYEIRPVEWSQTDKYASHFGKFEIYGVKVEIMGDLKIRKNNTWISLTSRLKHPKYVIVKDMKLPVSELKEQLQSYENSVKKKNKKKAKLIKRQIR